MDVHSTPKVTIDGGPGWQVDESSDVIGAEPRPAPRWRPSRSLVWTGAVSALVGFAAATGLAEWRHDRVGEIDAATLSVTVWSTDDGFGEPVAVKDGRPRIRVPFQLANTGPRQIELLSVSLLPGRAIQTEDLAGRRVAPGSQARLTLFRPLDCGSEARQVASEGDVSRLAVRARTDAGERQVEVRAALNTGLLSREMATAMCGDLPPDEALMSELAETSYADRGVALLSLQVANGSRHRITVERVTAAVPWLSARLVDEQGRAVRLPLSLPAGDFSPPRPPWGDRQNQTWRLEISVPDCRQVPDDIAPDYEQPLLVADVDSGQRAGTARLGGELSSVVRELVRSACA